MKFRVLAYLLLFALSLVPMSAYAAKPLQTAWIGEHEAFVVWYAKQKGWDKEEGLDIRMLRFGSGDKIVSRQGDYPWKIAGAGAVPTLLSARNGQYYIVGIGNDETELTALYVRPDSPILQTKGANPEYPEVFGSADSVRGKIILCPLKTSAHYMLFRWLKLLGLSENDVNIQDVLPDPAVNMLSKNFGDVIATWAPASFKAERKGFKIAATSAQCDAKQPILLLADRAFADKHPEQVQAFLRVYLRVLDEMREKGRDTFIKDYVTFNKTWANNMMTPEEAAMDLRLHPIFSLEEQVALFQPKTGNLYAWLDRIIEFYSQSTTPEAKEWLKQFDYVNGSFINAIERR